MDYDLETLLAWFGIFVQGVSQCIKFSIVISIPTSYRGGVLLVSTWKLLPIFPPGTHLHLLQSLLQWSIHHPSLEFLLGHRWGKMAGHYLITIPAPNGLNTSILITSPGLLLGEILKVSLSPSNDPLHPILPYFMSGGIGLFWLAGMKVVWRNPSLSRRNLRCA